MSGFLSPEAEAALMGDQDGTRRIYHQNHGQNPRMAPRYSRSPNYPQFTTTPTMTSASSRVPMTYAPPAQYTQWSGSSGTPYPSLGPEQYGRVQYPPTSTPIVPSSPYTADPQYSNAGWPALHPDNLQASSDNSRSVSPNPADLSNFGYLLPDGRTWRCAYPNCTSQATFTRGCDLRKHYHRHTKTLYCSYEDCAQSKEGGFSSKKDRDRHESRHAPKIRCTHKGCDRIFSRADNMKDHVRRIHGKRS
ncbi:hypothetical protein MMC21_000261 [Puttea exsequens]|nr:hypothetical protein [Puttea exsequens]